MTHQKRLPAPKHYPISRKKMKYISTVEGSRSSRDSIPAVVFLRDVLEYAESKKEAKKIIREGQLKRNGEPVSGIRQGIGVLDTVEIPETGEKYRVIRKGENLDFVPVEDSKTTAKITGKRTRGDEYVYELHSGENHRSQEEYDTGSTLVIDGSVKEIKLEEGEEVLVLSGKHAGKVGELKEITKSSLGDNTGKVSSEKQFSTTLENLAAVEGIRVSTDG